MNKVSMNFLTVENLAKTFDRGLVEALKGVSLSVMIGEVVSLMGPSGCGKSTLLGIIGTLDNPTAGRVLIKGTDLREISSKYELRACMIGFIFQFHHLVPVMTLLENVAAPMISLAVPKKQRNEKAMKLLCEVGLEKRANFFPNCVSGGERQRAAMARALINDPEIILADEPTGNLDTANGELVIELMLTHSRRTGATVIIATHNPEVAAKTDRIIFMKDGMTVI